MVIANELRKCRDISLPVLGKPFQIFEGGVQAPLAEYCDGIIGVLVEISVEYPLVHEIRLTSDVEEDPLQIVEFKGNQEGWIPLHRLFNLVRIGAHRSFSSRFELCDDRESVTSGRPGEDGTGGSFFILEVSLFGDRHRLWFCPIFFSWRWNFLRLLRIALGHNGCSHLMLLSTCMRFRIGTRQSERRLSRYQNQTYG